MVLSLPADHIFITQEFAGHLGDSILRKRMSHEGIDLSLPVGANVYAMLSGRAIYAGEQRRGHAYGIWIEIESVLGEHIYSLIYAHLSEARIGVGEIVVAGELIALSGDTGNSTAPHLHLTLKRREATVRNQTHFAGDVIDPTLLLDLARKMNQ